MQNTSVRIRRITVSALMLSLALVLSTFFSVYIPLFGQSGIKVGPGGIFSMLPSLLFGPWYGAAVSALSDLLGYLIKPQGAYIPELTLMAAVGGCLRGYLFMWLRKLKDKPLAIAVTIFSLVLIAVGMANQLCLNADGVNAALLAQGMPDTQGMHAVSRTVLARVANLKNPAAGVEKYSLMFTIVPMGCGGLGFVMLLANVLVTKYLFKERAKVSLLAILIAVMVSGLLVTTVNTFILKDKFWGAIPFMAVWLPRVAEEIAVSAVLACCLSVLMGVFENTPSLKKMVK